jgi:chaperonin cofactor prefoldin
MVQLKEESHSKTLTQARIKAETTETAELKAVAKKKLETSLGKARNFEKQNTTLTVEREQLEAKLAERQQVINELTVSLEDIRKKHGDTVASLGSRNNELIVKDEHLKMEVGRLSKESEEVDCKTNTLEKKVEDFVASMKIVERLEIELGSTLEDLKKELEDKKSVIQTVREEEVALREELREVKEYCHDLVEKHTNYMTERQDLFLSLRERMRQALSENQQLAAEYNRQQSCHMKTKANLMNILDRKLKVDSSLREHKQLMSLQVQMKSTLEDFYHLRGIHTENCYIACSVEAAHNRKRLESVEMRFSRALEEIKRFLAEHKTYQSCVQEEMASSYVEPLQDADLLTISLSGSDSRKRPVHVGTDSSACAAVATVSN